MSALGDIMIAAEALAVDAGLTYGAVPVLTRDGLTVVMVSWPGLAILETVTYPTRDEARAKCGAATVALYRP